MGRLLEKRDGIDRGGRNLFLLLFRGGRRRGRAKSEVRRRHRNLDFFLAHFCRYVFEQRGAQVAFAGVWQHAENIGAG